MQEPKLKMHREASNAQAVPGGRGRQAPGIRQTATPGARRTLPFSLHLLSFTCYAWCPKKDSGQPAGNWCSTSDWKHQILRQKSSRLEFLLSCKEKMIRHLPFFFTIARKPQISPGRGDYKQRLAPERSCCGLRDRAQLPGLLRTRSWDPKRAP